MRVGGSIGLGFKVTKQELERYRGSNFIDNNKIRSLRNMADIIIKNMGDVFVKIESKQPDIIEYEAYLTVIQTEEFNKAIKMLNADLVDLDETRKAFDNLLSDNR